MGTQIVDRASRALEHSQVICNDACQIRCASKPKLLAAPRGCPKIALSRISVESLTSSNRSNRTPSAEDEGRPYGCAIESIGVTRRRRHAALKQDRVVDTSGPPPRFSITLNPPAAGGENPATSLREDRRGASTRSARSVDAGSCHLGARIGLPPPPFLPPSPPPSSMTRHPTT